MTRIDFTAIDEELRVRAAKRSWGPSQELADFDERSAVDRALAETRQFLDDVTQVLAARLAAALVDGADKGARSHARELTWALRDIGLRDIEVATKQRIENLTLGPDPSEPPF